MNYQKTDWKDTLRDSQGVIIQRGTPLNSQIMEKIEQGIVDTEAKIDTDVGAFNGKLVESFDKSVTSAPQNRRKLTSGVLLVDDDMHPNSYTSVFNQVVKVRNVPYMFAAIPSRIIENASGSVSYEQFKEMQAHPLVTIANHTNTHRNLATLTEQQIIEEISIAEDWLRKEGVFTRCLVPPFGGVNDDVRKNVKKYCDTMLITYNTGGTANLNCADGAILNSDAVRRVEFSLPFAQLTALADLAKEHNALLVLSTHSGYSSNESNIQNFVLTKLLNFIDYCNSIQLPFLSYSEAYEIFKNVLEHRAINGTLLAGISANGESFGLNSKDFFVRNTLKNITDAPSFGLGPQLSFVKRSYSTANATLYGYPGAGQLLTTTGGDYGYTFELYQPLRSRRLLFRAYNDQTQTWSDFIDIANTLNMRGTLTFGASQFNPIPQGSAARYTITTTGVRAGDSIILNPNGHVLPTGIIVGAPSVTSNDQVTFPVLNMSNTEYNISGTGWVWRAIRSV